MTRATQNETTFPQTTDPAADNSPLSRRPVGVGGEKGKGEMSQKELVHFIDRAAQRAEMIEREPAIGKQCWFLAKLVLDSGCDADRQEYVLNTNLVLTKRAASRAISSYLSN